MSSFDLRSPLVGVPNKTSSGFANLGNNQLSVPALRGMNSGPLGYNSLPRLKPENKSGPSNLPQARRKLVNSALQSYLKSLNAMTRSIVLETESVEKEHQYDWKEMNEIKRETVMNEHFVPSGVRQVYESKRATSCCSLNSLGHFTSHQDDLAMDNRPTNLSQSSSNWEEGEGVSSRSNKNVYTNKWSSTACDITLSQPLPIGNITECVQPSKFDKLHKNQLSLRSSHKHAIKPRYSPPQKHILPSHQLGSDGESQRNSDEDYESNPLGFQRNKLRSFSMRSKRIGVATKSSPNFRSSARTTHKIRTSADGDESSDFENYTPHCRPSHYHSYSTSSTNTDFDEEIDMPDDTLLLNNVPRKILADKTDSNASFRPSSSIADHYITRGSGRATKTAMSRSEVISNSFFEDSTEFSASEDTSSTFMAESHDSNFFRSQSRASSDMDCMSMAPSDISKYDEESVLDSSMMAPNLSFQSKHKSNQRAVFRNGKGKRGGSHFRVATSDFVDRHSQFKTSMLQRHHLDSSTRNISPSGSVSSSILCSSVAESTTSDPPHSPSSSTTSDLPHSPSMLSCSMSTPLAISYTQHSHVLRKDTSSGCPEHRESGYISSSSESFPVAART